MGHRAVILVLAGLLAFPSLTSAEDEADHAGGSGHKTEIELSPELQQVLGKEMRAVQKGMMGLTPAIAKGEWHLISEIGVKIRDSYIMKQELSKGQKEELHRGLPEAFIEMDQAFHQTAGMMADAAEARNMGLVNFYFYKLNEGCVSCHSKYATERFPGFAKLRSRVRVRGH